MRNFEKKLLFYIIFGLAVVLIFYLAVQAEALEALGEYSIKYNDIETNVLCKESDNGVLLASLADIARVIGYKIEPVDELNIDRIYKVETSANGVRTSAKNSALIHRGENIASFIDVTAVLSAPSEFVDGVTYVAFDLYERFGIYAFINEDDASVTLVDVALGVSVDGESGNRESDDNKFVDSEFAVNELTGERTADKGYIYDEIIYAYSPDSESFEKTDSFVNEFATTRGVALSAFNALEDPSRLEELYEKAGVPDETRDIFPILFIGDSYLTDITAKNISDTLKGQPLEEVFENDFWPRAMRFISVFAIGLSHCVWPCAFPMFIQLLAFFFLDRKKTIRLGLCYCLGQFIALLLSGSVFFMILSIFDVDGSAFKDVLIGVIFVFAALNIIDLGMALADKQKKMILRFPSAMRASYENTLKKIVTIRDNRKSVFSTIVFGMAVTLGEFLFIGETYLSWTALLVKKGSSPAPYLILYSLAFVTPMLIIIFIVFLNKKIFGLSKIFNREAPKIKLASAVILLIFGADAIFSK